MKKLTATTLVILVAALASGCGKTPSADSASRPENTAAQLPATLMVASVDGEPISLLQAKQAAKAGEPVLLTGHIGGRPKPFVQGRSMFTLVDSSLPACTDGCATAWDLCCESPADITAAAATIQVVDDAGRPLAVSLEGPGLLAPGQRVAVAGTVHQRDDATFVVNAERIAILD